MAVIDESLGMHGMDRTVHETGVTPEILAQINNELDWSRASGWTQEHDDRLGPGHLVTEAVDRLQHMGEYPTDDFVDHTLTVAIGLLVNAKLTLARARNSGHTLSLGETE